jgi:N-ATPase, AtpR subunit
MTEALSPLKIGVALSMVAFGFALGLLYFATLRRSLALFIAGRSWLGPLALTLARLGGIVVFFAAIAKLGGALPLLAAFAGFLTARTVMLRAPRRAA